MTATKNDIIVSAYEHMRISGLTVIPSAADNALALKTLENLMAELANRNILVDYNFENTPLLTSRHNIERRFWFAIEMLLADRLLSAFGKDATPSFIRARSAAQSSLSSACARVNVVPYPSRMPKGIGNFYSDRFYPPAETAPIEPSTFTMYIGDIDDFVESFIEYLNAGETISSYVLTADTGLTIVSESLASPNINYQVSAVGNNEEDTEILQVKIVITTSTGRVKTRINTFELLSADVID